MSNSSAKDSVQPEISCDENLSEYWTPSRQGVVLTGERSCIIEIVGLLGLLTDSPVEVTESVWALALCDAEARRYLEYTTNGTHDTRQVLPTETSTD